MHLPMSNAEIACFLQVPIWAIEGLIQSNRLSRTIGCPYRPLEALNWSSVYDVLEFSLTCGCLPITVTREVAALWVFALAEADEFDGFESNAFDEQTDTLANTALTDGLASDKPSAVQFAELILETRLTLLEICSETDKDAA